MKSRSHSHASQSVRTDPASAGAARGRRRSDRLVPVGLAVGALVVGATTLALTNDTSNDSATDSASITESATASSGAPGPSTPSEPTDSATDTTGDGAASAPATATVTRGPLTEVRKFNGTVNFGDPWTLPTTATGVVTEVPEAGSTLELGTAAIRVNNLPVLLVEGSMPLYRTLEKVNVKSKDEYGTRRTLLAGDDVVQLQNFLIGQGFDEGGKLTADGVYGDVTVKAVKAWQKANGFPISGKIDATQIVFSPSPLRVAETIRTGITFEGLKVSEVNPAVFVSTSARDRNLFAVGTEVAIEQPDGSRLTGVVDRQERGTADDGSQTWKARIQPSEDLANDIEAVSVETTRVLADDALIVPTSALIALAEGGFAVEVVDGGSSHLVAVEIIDVLEDRAAVSGDIDVDDNLVVAQ